MKDTEEIFKSFRKHPKHLIYENEDNVKTLSKEDDFFSSNADNLIDLAASLVITYNEMKIGKDKSFYWNGTINTDIKWIFSIGGNTNNGLFFTMNLQKIDENLFEGLRKVVSFFNGQFKKEVIKKLHNNSF